MTAKERTQNHTEEEKAEIWKKSVAGALRALAYNPELSVEFQGNTPRITQDHIFLPDIGHNPNELQKTLLRGQADSIGLWIAHHDEVLCDELSVSDSSLKDFCDRLEQVRVEALGIKQFQGIARNIQKLYEFHDEEKKELFQNTESQTDIPAEEALFLLLREELTGLPTPDISKKALNLWRSSLEEKAGNLFKELSQHIENQRKFSIKIKELVDLYGIFDNLRAREEEGNAPPLSENETPDRDKEEKSEDPNEEFEQDSDNVDLKQGGEAKYSTDESEDGEEEEPLDTNEIRQPRGKNPFQNERDSISSFQYKVFTTAFDEILKPEDAISEKELIMLRSLLDKQLVHLQTVVSRLAHRLQRLLQAQQNRAWDFDCEEGMLDPSRITRIITDPLAPVSFKQERETDFRDTVVTLLIDNSGSMRGKQIIIAATCTDILARTLERCGVKVEVLGFTTREWRGGQAKAQWLQAEKPENPGRLNELRHIIYKAADSPWRRAKNNIALMLRENLLKENIDGEALLWASQRLLHRPEQRRILMVISDGTPLDEGTASANPANYLEHHLHQVIQDIERRQDIELIAIGIGYDVSRFYRRAVTIHDAEELGGVMLEKLTELFSQK